MSMRAEAESDGEILVELLVDSPSTRYLARPSYGGDLNGHVHAHAQFLSLREGDVLREAMLPISIDMDIVGLVPDAEYTWILFIDGEVTRVHRRGQAAPCLGKMQCHLFISASKACIEQGFLVQIRSRNSSGVCVCVCACMHA